MYQNRDKRGYNPHGNRSGHESSLDENKIRNIKSNLEQGNYSVINDVVKDIIAKPQSKFTSNMLRNIYQIVQSYHREKNELRAKNIALARIIYLVMKNTGDKEFVKLVESIFSINDADIIKDAFEAMVCYSKLHLKK